jgi:hypothetical protein
LTTASVLLGVGRDEGIAVLLASTTNVERVAAWRRGGIGDGATARKACARGLRTERATVTANGELVMTNEGVAEGNGSGGVVDQIGLFSFSEMR